MPGPNDPTGYGETATVEIDHTNLTPYDCVATGAVIFSTDVKDVDLTACRTALKRSCRSGPEDSPRTRMGHAPRSLRDGPRVPQREMLIEMDAMIAGAGTAYGASWAPFSAEQDTKADDDGHDHKPSPAAVKIMIDTYLNAPSPIVPLIDVGNPAIYITALGDNYEPYFVARGLCERRRI